MRQKASGLIGVRRAIPALVVTCGFATACESGESGYTPGQYLVDSLPELTFIEESRIGSVDDPNLGFSRIGGVQVASDGSIVVLEQQEREIRIFGRDGRLIRRIGGTGSGPGELRSPSDLGLRGDTIWVYDYRNVRLTLFDLEGTVLATVPAGGVRVPVPGANVRIVPAEPLGNGRYGSRILAATEGMMSMDSMTVPALVFDASGSAVDTAGTHFIPGSPVRQVSVRSDGGMGYGVLLPEPLHQWPLTIPVNGDTIIVSRTVAASEADGVFTITRRTSGGDTAYHTRLRYRPIVVDADSVVAASMRANEGIPLSAAAMESVIREAIPPERFYPPVEQHEAGPDGTLWLQREDVGGDRTRWLVVDTAGRPYGTVQLPRTMRLMWVSGEGAWVRERDELDVPWLVWHRLGT